MRNVKIIFFDIDGTLIDMEAKQISARTISALKRLKENGIRLCPATGRSPMTLPDWQEIEFDAYLTFNGSLCYTKDKIIFNNSIPQQDVQQIIRNAAQLGRPVSLATKDTLAANGYDRDLADYYSIAHIDLTVSPDFEKISKQEIYQIMLGCRECDHPHILSGVSGAKIAAWWDRAADVIPANGGKGIGVQKILSYFGIKKEEALAFGDGSNDIDMLKSVGTGIAMENASPALKAAADEICGHVNADGIYHYCLQHGLL